MICRKFKVNLQKEVKYDKKIDYKGLCSFILLNITKPGYKLKVTIVFFCQLEQIFARCITQKGIGQVGPPTFVFFLSC